MHDESNSIVFRYPLSQLIITYLLVPIVSLIGFAMGAFLLESAGSILVGIFLIVAGICFIFLSMFGSLMCSSIVVNDEGISAHNFRRTLRTIHWREVKKVHKVRRWNAGSRSFEDVFYVFDGTFSPLRERMVNLRGPIAFSDRILRLRGLLDRINDAAHRHHFLLVVSDQEEARKLAAKAQLGAWKRTVPDVDETVILEL